MNQQAKLIQLMGNLLSNGFHLGEVVRFLEVSNLVERDFVLKMKASLTSGASLAGILNELNFSKNVVTQVELVNFHGHLSGTMQRVEQNLQKQLKIKNKLISLLIYPLLLLFFVFSILIGLNNYLLPQLGGQSNFATKVLRHFPELFLCGFLFLILLTALSVIVFQSNSAISSFSFASKIPILVDFIRLYLTGYFAREWGNLIAQGVDLNQILVIMIRQKSRIFSELGQRLEEKFEAGADFHQSIKTFSFFNPELALMIEYGSMKDKLGAELLLYADECFEQFFLKIDRAMQWIQPLVFIFVALMIVLLYAAMLLPIYSNMGTMLG